MNGTVNRKKDHEAISMDAYVDSERDGLMRCHRDMDDMLGQSTSLLTSLKSQGDSFRNIRKVNRGINEVLGMSQTLMRLIQKRVSGDKIILFGGMAAFTLFMLLVWIFLL